MRNTVAKRIRRLVYGEDGATRNDKYMRNDKTGQIICGENRRLYQKTKHAHTRKGSTQ